MFEHDFLETEQTPRARSMSRYRGILKLEAARFDRVAKVSASCHEDTETVLRLAQGKKMRLDPRELLRKAGCCPPNKRSEW
jgi:hypothetical protein